MKSFAISVLLLLLMLGGIALNYIYINEVADTMLEYLDTLPDVGDPACSESASAIAAYWEERVDIVGLSVGYTIVDRVSEQAATLAACAECGDLYGYRTALALLRDAIGDMRRLEGFSIGNLL